MAILSTLLAVSEPTGFWETIIRAFDKVCNNYVLAVIFLTVVIRVIWAIVDTYSKYNQQKMNAIQQKMQPELDKIKARYEKTPQVMNQKQNEVYRKYMNRSYYSGCLVTFLMMALNLVVFFTLLGGLNSMASYNITTSYNNLKYTYANTLNVVDEYLGDYSDQAKLSELANYQSLGIEIYSEEDGDYIALVRYAIDGEEFVRDENGNLTIEEELYRTLYKTDFSTIEETTIVDGSNTTIAYKAVTDNDYIVSLINKLIPVYQEGDAEGSLEVILIEDMPVLDENGQQLVDENGQPLTRDLYLSEMVQNLAMNEVALVYDVDKDSFLWIENIWLADSPTTQSIMSFQTLSSQVSGFEAREEEVYNAFIPDLDGLRGRVNGYYILPILCILVSTLSILLTNWHNKHKNKKLGKETVKQKGAMKWMQILVPVLLGLFALFYSSIFAIYMLTGQVVSTILLPLQLLIIDKIMDKKKEKEDKANDVVEYSRKF